MHLDQLGTVLGAIAGSAVGAYVFAFILDDVLETIQEIRAKTFNRETWQAMLWADFGTRSALLVVSLTLTAAATAAAAAVTAHQGVDSSVLQLVAGAALAALTTACAANVAKVSADAYARIRDLAKGVAKLT